MILLHDIIDIKKKITNIMPSSYEIEFRQKYSKYSNVNRINKTLGFNHPVFNKIKKYIEDEDHFMTNPLEIEKGVLTCKCGSQKTISFQRQIRSADEGFTTFAQCVECGHRWRQ